MKLSVWTTGPDMPLCAEDGGLKEKPGRHSGKCLLGVHWETSWVALGAHKARFSTDAPQRGYKSLRKSLFS